MSSTETVEMSGQNYPMILSFIDSSGSWLGAGLSRFVPRFGDSVTLSNRTFRVDRVNLEFEQVDQKPDVAMVLRRDTVHMTEQQ